MSVTYVCSHVYTYICFNVEIVLIEISNRVTVHNLEQQADHRIPCIAWSVKIKRTICKI